MRVISPFVPLVDLVLLVLAFFDSSLLNCHFWPFTGVLRKIFGSLTREVWEFLKTPRITRMSRMRSGRLRQKGSKETKSLFPFLPSVRKNVSAIRRNQVAAATAPYPIPCRASGSRTLASVLSVRSVVHFTSARGR